MKLDKMENSNETNQSKAENELDILENGNETNQSEAENELDKMENLNETNESEAENELDKMENLNETNQSEAKNELDEMENLNETNQSEAENELGKSANKSQTYQSVNESETTQSAPILMLKETILECWLCEEGHSTKKCPKIAAAHKVRDKPVPSRARVTLPDSLLIVKLEDPLKRLMVVAKTSISRNTMFGPLDAPKVKDTKDHIGYKIFDEEEGTFALDCSNENDCNWMSLVNFSSNNNKNNLVAYQLNKLIYFSSIREINAGEELLVSFSKVYRKKIDQISGTVPEEISRESNSQIIEIFDPFNYYSSILKDGPKTVIYIEEDEIENNLQETISQKLACLNSQTSSTIAKMNVSKSNSLQISSVSSMNTSTVQQLGANRSNFLISAPSATTVKLPSTMKFLGSSKSILNLGSNSSSAQANVKQLTVSGTSKTINSPRPFQLMGDSSSTKSPSTRLKTNQASTLNARLSDSLYPVKPASTQNTVKIINIVTRSPPHPASDVDSVMDNDDDSDISWKPDKNEKNSKEIRRSPRKRKTTAAVEALLSKHRKFDTKKAEPVANKLQLFGKNLVPVVKKLEISNLTVKPKAGLEKVDITPAKYEARGRGKAETLIEQYKINFAKELVKKSGYGCLGITVETESWTCSVCDTIFEDCIDLAFHLKRHFEANFSRKKRKKQRPKPKLEGEPDESKSDDDASDNSYIYSCDLCTNKITDRRDIFLHLQKHTGEFYCRLCEKVFTHLNTVKNHNCTANPQQWICDVCNKVLSTREGLKYHKYCYHSEPKLPCQKCGEKFLFKSRLRVHTLSCKAEGKSGESPPKMKSKKLYECKPCEKVFYNRSMYEKHLPKHTGEFACQFCGKWLASKPSLKEHVVICMTQNVVGNHNSEEQVLDENGQIACSYCNEIFIDLVKYRTHFYQHLYPFECQICGYRAKLNHELIQHVCFEREFKCKVCNSTFSAFCNLKEHRIKENHHDPPTLPEKELEELKDQCFLCDLCGASFKTKMKLKCHSILHKEKKFSCKVCHKKFLRKKDWERHEFTHQEKSIPCPYCSDLFKSKNVLLVHIRGHEGIRRYSCPFCDKSFMQKGNLNKHLDTHDKNKRYCCSLCSMNYSCKDSLRDHEKVHKFGKNFNCEICFKSFLKAHQLKKHVTNNHSVGKRFACKYCGVVIKLLGSLQRHLIRKHLDRKSDWKDPEVVKSMLGEHTVSAMKNKEINVRKKDEHPVSATKKKRINVKKKNDDSSDISSTSEDDEDFGNYSDDSNNKGGETNLNIAEELNQDEKMESEAPSTLIYLAENCANLNNQPQSHYEEKSNQYSVPENQYQNDNILTHTDFNTGEVVIVTSVEEPQQEYEERVISSDFLVHQDGTDNLVMYVDTMTG